MCKYPSFVQVFFKDSGRLLEVLFTSSFGSTDYLYRSVTNAIASLAVYIHSATGKSIVTLGISVVASGNVGISHCSHIV